MKQKITFLMLLFSIWGMAQICTITATNADPDGDGVANACDLDSDNDGILDTVECPPTNIVTNGTFTGSLSGWLAGTGWLHSSTVGAYNDSNTSISSKLSQSLTGLNNAKGGIVAVNVRLGAQDASNSANSTGRLEIALGGTVYARILNGTARDAGNITITMLNGANSNFIPFGTNGIMGYSQSSFTIYIPYSGPNAATLSFDMYYTGSASNDDWSVDDVSINTFVCDTDKDTIPNYLDLDSDNDGCPDVIEGGASFRTGATYINANRLSTTVDGNGVPALPTATPAITGYSQAAGQTVSQSQDRVLNDCIDSDGDGYGDWEDLDDDNDGILDTDECAYVNSFSDFAPSSVVITNPNSDPYTTVTGIIMGSLLGDLKIENFGGAATTGNVMKNTSDRSASGGNFSPAGTTTQSVLSMVSGGFNTAGSYTRYTLEMSKPVESVTLHIANWDFMRTRFTGSHVEKLLSGGSELIYDPATRQLYDLNPNTYSDVTRDGYGSIKITSADGLPFKTIIFEKFVDPNSNQATNLWDGNNFNFSAEPACDLDGDGIPNRLDLDSDGDGCPDAVEGAGTFTPSQLVDSTMPGGNAGTGYNGASTSPVIQNLPTPVGNTATTRGIPTIAGTGQALGTSQTANPVLNAGTASANQIINSGTSPAALSLTGYAGTIQWQVSTDNLTFTNVPSAGTGASYSPGPLSATRYYRALVTSVGGCTATSNVLTITILCNEPPNDLSTSVPVHHGITLLGRGGTDHSNWPMERNSAYTALEAKTKGFVITRISDPETAIATPVVGMMVFDTDENAGKGCLKIYTGSGTGEGWKCFITPTCP